MIILVSMKAKVVKRIESQSNSALKSKEVNDEQSSRFTVTSQIQHYKLYTSAGCCSADCSKHIQESLPKDKILLGQ